MDLFPLPPPLSISSGKALRRALVRSTLRFLRALTGAAEALSLGRLQAQAAAAVVAARRSRRRSSTSEGGDGEDENDGDNDDDDDGGDARLVLRRFAEAGRDSYTLTLQAVIYYATLHLLSFFAIEKAIFAFRGDLERWVCRVGGVWHVTADGRRLPYTLPSAMDADFSTPGYNPGRGFPYGDGEEEERRRSGCSSGTDVGSADAAAAASAPAPPSSSSSSSAASVPRIPFARPDDPRNAHFASLVCKAVYEDSAVVADLVSSWIFLDLSFSRSSFFFFPTKKKQKKPSEKKKHILLLPHRCATSGACASPATAASPPTGPSRTGCPTSSGSSPSRSAA